MAGLEELKRRLQPIFFDADGNVVPPPAADGTSDDSSSDDCEVLDGGTVNLLSRSSDEYNISKLGFHKRTTRPDGDYATDKAYRCSCHDMHIFDSVGNGASSVVHRAIYVPVHRVLALKKINIFDKEKRQQILNEIRTLSAASCYPGLVEFQGVFYTPDSGEIYFALEYMDGGSLADIIRVKKFITEPVLSHMLQKVLLALRYLHEVRRLVHRDIKPANLLLNLKGDTKITDFGVSSGLHDSVTMCATFLGSVTYMSPERIRNENYSYAADIWSLGLTALECATGRYPYDVNGGEADLMLQKDADARPTCDQKYEGPGVDLAEYNKSVHDPAERLSQIAHENEPDVLQVHIQ
uniref:mitogen-activated protein kinase kinase n=1 Tax=Aegilops tauschii TaxID=37682 RepID=M8C9Z7_AEGTA